MQAAADILVGAKDNTKGVIQGIINTIRESLNEVAKVAVKATEGVSAVATVFKPIAAVAGSLAVILKNVVASVGVLFAVVFNTLRIIQTLFSMLASVFTFVKSIVQSAFTLIKSVGSAIGSLFAAISSRIGSLFAGAHGHLGTTLKYGLGVAAAIGAAFIGTALAAEHAWQPLAQTIGRIVIAGVGGAAIAGLRQFAVEVRRATLTASGDVMALVEQAVRLRIPEAQLKAVSAAALGLSTALGISAESAMSKLAAAMRGNFDELKSLIPALKGATNDAARLAIVTGIAKQGIDLAGGSVSTFSGLWRSFKNVLAENAQVLGEKIAPGIKLIVDAIRPLLGLLESSGSGFAKLFNTIAEFLAPVISKLVGWFATVFASVVAFSETVSQHWRLTWEFVATAFEYYTTVIKAEVVHFFTSSLPTYFKWFKEFASEWADALGNGLKMAFQNLWQNLADISSVGWELFKDKFKGFLADLGLLAIQQLGTIGNLFAKWSVNPIGEATKAATQAAKDYFTGQQAVAAGAAHSWAQKFKDAWSRSLADGFKGIDKALPGLPGSREASGQESALKGRMAELGGALASIFQGNFSNALEGFRDILGRGAQASIKGDIDGLSPLGASAGGKGSDHGNSLLESRFATRAPGSTPIEQIPPQLSEVIRLHQQHLESAKAAEKSAEGTQRRVDEIMSRLAMLSTA